MFARAAGRPITSPSAWRLPRRLRRGGLWLPEVELVTPGDPGAVYHPGKSEDVRQNPDGTGTVTPGGTVGWLKDRSGNGRHATQPDANKRPIWHADGFLDFSDGKELTANVGAIVSATLAFAYPDGPSTTTGVDLSDGILRLFGDFFALTVLDRVPTAAEQADLDAYLTEQIVGSTFNAPLNLRGIFIADGA